METLLMNNKDYLYLLTKGKKKKKFTAQDIRFVPKDESSLTINQARILQHLNEEIRQIAQEYTFMPNTDATRDALALSIGQTLSHYRQQGVVNDAYVRDIQMHSDGTATINVAYQSPLNYIDINITT